MKPIQFIWCRLEDIEWTSVGMKSSEVHRSQSYEFMALYPIIGL